MTWNIQFYAGVDELILNMPVKIQARFIRIMDLMEAHGANLGSPHTKSLGSGLFEIRVIPILITNCSFLMVKINNYCVIKFISRITTY